MVAEVKNQQKLTRANSLKEKKEKKTKARLEHAAARLLKITGNQRATAVY